jgi:hypothetical protein
LVIGRTAETIALSNGVDIEYRPASYRTIRGVTAVAIVADEVAFCDLLALWQAGRVVERLSP